MLNIDLQISLALQFCLIHICIL